MPLGRSSLSSANSWLLSPWGCKGFTFQQPLWAKIASEQRKQLVAVALGLCVKREETVYGVREWLSPWWCAGYRVRSVFGGSINAPGGGMALSYPTELSMQQVGYILRIHGSGRGHAKHRRSEVPQGAACWCLAPSPVHAACYRTLSYYGLVPAVPP